MNESGPKEPAERSGTYATSSPSFIAQTSLHTDSENSRLCVMMSCAEDVRPGRGGEQTKETYDTTLELLDRLDQGSERLAVEVVGGCSSATSARCACPSGHRRRTFVEDEDVRPAPCRGTEDNLDLLTTGETARDRERRQRQARRDQIVKLTPAWCCARRTRPRDRSRCSASRSPCGLVTTATIS